MTKVVSDAQLAANCLNAAESTGPTTAAGKARASRNALKHGLLSAQVVVGDGAERPEEFQALLESLIEDFDPQDVIEQALVERVATCLWRHRRAQRFHRRPYIVADPHIPGAERVRRRPGQGRQGRWGLRQAAT